MSSTLAICIPTYNRREYLLELLEILIPQVLPYDIPIYISDNHSSDDTVIAVKSFAKEQYQRIFIQVNPENYGFDINVSKVVAMASEDYVWLVPDDDRPNKDAISKIILKLDFNYALIAVNLSRYNRDFSQ